MMIGRRYVHEFNTLNGSSRGWHETLDHKGNVRQVRPELNNHMKKYYIFDQKITYKIMQLTFKELNQKFVELIEGECSRESVDRWAYDFIQYDEVGQLNFDPISKEENLREGLMYLYGIDIQESPGIYLHDIEDIIEKYNQIFNKEL